MTVTDLFNPQYELRNGVYVALESVASIDGLVGIGDVHGINLSDAQSAMEIGESVRQRKKNLRALLRGATAGKKTAALVVQPFAYKWNDPLEIPAAEADASLVFHFTYQCHPTHGLVDVSYQQQSVSEIPFPDLRYGLQEMEEAYKKIRKELEYAQDWGKDTELTATWKQKEPYLAKRFGWEEPIPDGVSFEAWSQANKRNWAHVTAAADEFGRMYLMLDTGDIVDRRAFFRVPKIEQVSP